MMNVETFLVAVILVVSVQLAFSQQKPSSTGPTIPASPAKQSSGPATNRQATADFPIIGHVEKQDRTITIKAGTNGTIYTVKSADGKTLYDNVTLEQLRAQAPDLHEFVKTAVAGNITNGPTADSRIRVTDGQTRSKPGDRIR